LTWDQNDVRRTTQPAGPAWQPHRVPPDADGSPAGDLTEDDANGPATPFFLTTTQGETPAALPWEVRQAMAQAGLWDDATLAQKRRWYTRGIPAL
jgi:hypothetical protein